MTISISASKKSKLPILLAIISKGYKITVVYEEKNGEINKDKKIIYEADREDSGFSANSPEQLLGLITMWEIRGNDWRYDSDTEPNIHQDLINKSITYDLEGNIIES